MGGKTPGCISLSRSPLHSVLFVRDAAQETYRYEESSLGKNLRRKRLYCTYVPRQLKLSSVLEMDENDYEYVSILLQKNSETVPGVPNPRLPELTSPCLLWLLHVDCYGAPSMKLFGKNVSPTRIVWEMVHGEEVPPKMLIRHKCAGRRHCIAEDHLEIGTAKENANDMRRDGTLLIGEKHPNTTLTDDIVRQIFASRTDGRTREKRAEAFGVSIDQIWRIDTFRSWKHLFSQEQIDAETTKPPKKKGDLCLRKRFVKFAN